MTQLEFYTLARSLLVPSKTGTPRFQKLAVTCYHVNVSLDEQLAATAVEIVFRNPNDLSVGGTFILPLPDSADISNTEVRIDGNLANKLVWLWLIGNF